MLTSQFGEAYATQVVSSSERRIVANILNGSIRAKATLQHLALVATEMVLQTPTWTAAEPNASAQHEDGKPGGSKQSQQHKAPRYQAMRKYVRPALVPLSVQDSACYITPYQLH